ncbi:hypothetical protein HYC85_024840 [Camellia sinensis]|uniref:pectinesterase n=1 Tax=Camellia sinensis TaxID=4442 RepID=A0A7J7GD67_CAMSI|nr:hypothetical protein HYC85_024840 [Camellia sinensis]
MYHHRLSQRPNPLCIIIIFLTLPTISAIVFLTLSSQTPLIKIPKPKPTITSLIHTQIANTTCDGTLYPDLCVSTISTFPDLLLKSLPQIIAATVNHSVTEVRASESNCSGILRTIPELAPLDKQALDDCIELLDNTIAELKTVIADLSANKTTSKHFRDLQTLLSGAMTNQYTCLDGFAYSKGNVRPYIEDRLDKISHHVSNALAMLRKIPAANAAAHGGGEVFPEYGKVRGGFPTWVSRKDRRLLQAAVNQTRYNLVVAKDGSGNFTTIGEAVAAAPNSSETRFVIYVKGGAYYENVEVERKKTKLMLVGDGIGKTLVKDNRMLLMGGPLSAVVGNGFIAKGITFENYAGPSKHQAVAFRSGSDFSAFFQCSFIGYQDTLYVHSLRQFYRDCDIYGTNCNLYARKPDDTQKNIITAQGRDDPFQTTGISIISCKIAAALDLIPVQSSFKTYLGRPWKQYSRTVYLLSNIGDLVDPAGWLEVVR